MTDWIAKLDAYRHDPPEKVLDLAWHKQRAEDYGHTGDAFYRPCDHTAAAADRLPWPAWRFLESKFDGKENHFKHPLGGARFLIAPYSHADIAHHFASINRPELTEGDDRARFFAHWRLWRWWASDNKDSRLAFLPADTRLPDHTIWAHNSIVSALQACVVDEGASRVCRPAFLLFQIGPVQEYIAQARRTLDLWSGSYLLSYLIANGLRHIALHYGPDNVIFPNLCGQPIFDLLVKEEIWERAKVQLESSGSAETLWESFRYELNSYGRQRLLTPSLPNRFLAIVPAGSDGSLARQIAEETEQAVRHTFGEIARKVWFWLKERLTDAADWSAQQARFDDQVDRFLDVSWQVLPWPSTPEKCRSLAACLPANDAHRPLRALETILEMARVLGPGHPKRFPSAGTDDHRDARNYECERFPAGTVKDGRDVGGWKDRSKLKPDAQLDNPGSGWSALYQLVTWQLDAVRQTRAWRAWAEGGWKVGRECNKDSLNGKEEALLVVGSSEADAEALNRSAGIPNLFKPGEFLGASTLIKRLWPTAWLQSPDVHRGRSGGPLFRREDFSMPDTRQIADGKAFEEEGSDEGSEEAQKYFAVLAFDGDEMGRWVSGLHRKMPKLGDQLSDYIDPETGIRAGAKRYFEENGFSDLLDRERPLNPSFHLQFSEMLANFSNFCVRRIVEAHDGRLIYAGGDDVVALLPASTALNCARALRAAFQGDPEILNNLRGGWRGSARIDPPPRLFDFEQPGFIRLHQEAPKLEGEPGRFYAMVPGPAADCSVGIAIAHFKAPLQDVVRAAQAAEKRAKKQLGRSAVAATLMKRSGEIIEWGCQWDSGGLKLYADIAARLAQGDLSAKFPHRVCEFLAPYLTAISGLTGESHAVTSVEDFDRDLCEIVRREFTVALTQQTPLRGETRRKLVAEVGQSLDGYLRCLERQFDEEAKKFEERLAEGKAKAWQRPRKPDSICGALIGLCQTVAFARRTSEIPPASGDGSPEPARVPAATAERQTA